MPSYGRFRRPVPDPGQRLAANLSPAPGPFIGHAKSFSSAVFGTAYRITEDSVLSLVAGSSDSREVSELLAMKLLVEVRHYLSSMLVALLVQQRHEVIQVYAAVILGRTVLAPTADGPAAPELNGPLCRELKTLSKIFGPFTFEGMQLVDGAVDRQDAGQGTTRNARGGTGA